MVGLLAMLSFSPGCLEQPHDVRIHVLFVVAFRFGSVVTQRTLLDYAFDIAFLQQPLAWLATAGSLQRRELASNILGPEPVSRC